MNKPKLLRMDRNQLRKGAVQAVRRVHPRFGLRKSDVILASFPKSGNTWMRFIWANIVSELELGGRTIDFRVLDGEMSANHDKFLYGSLEFTSLPRLVKTHERYDRRIFGDSRVVYIHRHPGDVMASYHAFRKAKVQRPSSRLSFAEFLRHEKYGVRAWARHLESWLPKATTVISYESLKRGGVAEVRRIFDDLGIEGIEDATLEKAVERSSFQRTRELETRYGRPQAESSKFESSFKFTRKGDTGDWRQTFDEDDVRFAREAVTGLGLGDPFAG